MMADAELDASGLICPLPVLRAKKALKPLAPGQTLRVIATDPAAAKDFPAFCDATGNQLIEASGDGMRWTFLIRRA
jgi:tRNA 2-thiouridine synthesizing protein A